MCSVGNSLLDFVLALVRDPEVSARYAADPAGVLADAHLPGVTIGDVNNLIPVVTDSLAVATPGFGANADAGNVWTTGAAVAAFDAFDAFDIRLPPAGEHQIDRQPGVILPSEAERSDRTGPHHPVTAAVSTSAPDETPAHPSLDPVNPDWVDDAALHHPNVDPQYEPDQGGSAGFDLF
jgi:hypothetical protein